MISCIRSSPFHQICDAFDSPVYVLQSHGSHTQPHLSGNNVLNDVISLYFDRMESVEKPNKQVRFDEVVLQLV